MIGCPHCQHCQSGWGNNFQGLLGNALGNAFGQQSQGYQQVVFGQPQQETKKMRRKRLEVELKTSMEGFDTLYKVVEKSLDEVYFKLRGEEKWEWTELDVLAQMVSWTETEAVERKAADK